MTDTNADPGTENTPTDDRTAGSPPSGDTSVVPETTQADAADSGMAEANAEAKSWRLKYRAADTRAQVAEARVEQQNRRHVERVLATRLADPTDAWANGLDLDAVLDGDGLVDDEAVLTYAEELIAAKPHYAAKLRPVGAPASAVNGSDPIPTPGSGINWQGLLGGKTG